MRYQKVYDIVEWVGFCTVALRKLKASPEKMPLPYEYKGDVHVVGGDGDVASAAYVWAGLRRREAEETAEVMAVSRRDFFESLGVERHVLQPKKPPERELSGSKSKCRIA